MKTIKEAAKKHTDTYCPGSDNLKNVTGQDINDYVYSAFCKGAEFAQQWISVDDELPELGIVVLIKDKNNYVGMSCRRYGDWDYKFRGTVTHWRPITRI